MKGLLYREFYLGRKYYLLSFIMYFLVMMIGILVRLSMLYGNLSLPPEEALFQVDDNAKIIITALPCVVIFSSFCTDGDGGVIFSDYNSNWIKFCGTTPLSEKKIAGVKFIVNFITMIAALVFSVIYIAVICAISSEKFTFDIFKNLIFLFALATLSSCLYLTLSIKYKNKNAVTIRLVGIFAVIYIPVMMTIVTKMEIGSGADEDDSAMMKLLLENFEQVRDIVFVLSPVIIIASIAVGCLLSVRFLKRREN